MESTCDIIQYHITLNCGRMGVEKTFRRKCFVGVVSELELFRGKQGLQKVGRPPSSLAAASSQGFALCLSFSGNVIVRKTKQEFQTRKVQRIAFLAEMGSW